MGRRILYGVSDTCVRRSGDVYEARSPVSSSLDADAAIAGTTLDKGLRHLYTSVCASDEYTPLDRVDRAIIQLLQRDARNLTAVEIAEAVGVSDGTVRNRIENLERQNIIEGYVPVVDYENAGYQLEVVFECTAPIVDREALGKEAVQIKGVVEVLELMTGRANLQITAVAPRRDDVTRIAKALDELGLQVEHEKLIRHKYLRPFNHFGTENVSDERDGTYEV